MTQSNQTQISFEEAAKVVSTLRKNIEELIYGQDRLVTESLCVLFAGGHILMTGAPGLAKTTLVRVIARFLGLQFGRVQFTPDLLPSDITGSDVLNIDTQSGKRTFDFSAGPIFTNLLLADEINRASPRTQSALLEAMQERNVTVGGARHILPRPFMVFATQNPYESEGTFLLPEAQLDRFLMHSLVEYPDVASEQKILETHARQELVGEQASMPASSHEEKAIHIDTFRGVLERVKMVRVPESLIEWVNFLVRSSRPQDESCPDALKPMLSFGAGPRGGISMLSAAKALALMESSESVSYAHLKRVAPAVLRHRMRLSAQAFREQLTEDKVIEILIERAEKQFLNKGKGLS